MFKGGLRVKHIKGNSYDVVRLIINQLGISIFALVLYIAMATVGENNPSLHAGLKIVSSVFSIFFYWMLIYAVVWEIGAKDRIKIDTGKAVDFKPKGFVMGVLANLGCVILSLVAIGFKAAYLIFGIDGFNTVVLISTVIIRFVSAMYIGLVSGICSPITNADYNDLFQAISYFALFALTILVCHIAYTLGKNNFKFFGNKAK